ncbi:hypothetical protein [Natrononativus amylolyticus]|uniref:hypothetical protein n=1 Tax=Natrononativus amylolyticus TaxID=2963434 RepID=UPI0020CCDAE3|nr:hypothetical protein [Natrononativus amylolyticus]
MPGDADGDAGRKGFRDGLESSQGDPRVLFVLNAALSALFGWLIVWGLDVLGVVDYGATTVAAAAIVLFALTYVMSRR